MTFEATDTRAPAAAADEASASPRRPLRRPARPEHPVDTMMGFVSKSEHVACHLRGLALLFRGVFCDDDVRVTDDASAAADIIDDVLKNIADRLEANGAAARVTCDHLTREGTR